jgi:hypothetical protein
MPVPTTEETLSGRPAYSNATLMLTEEEATISWLEGPQLDITSARSQRRSMAIPRKVWDQILK